MPRKDHTLAQAVDGALLYTDEEATSLPPEALPAPRCDLLDLGYVERLTKFVACFFMLDAYQQYVWKAFPLCTESTRAYVLIPSTAIPVVVRTVADLVDLLPAIGRWLANWAHSPDRCPCLTPSWAISAKLDPSDVVALADNICKHVAAPCDQTLRIRSLAGHHAEITIPAKARLRPSALKHRDATEAPHIVAIQDVITAMTAGGQKTVIRDSNDSLRRLEPGDTLEIPKSTLHDKCVRVYANSSSPRNNASRHKEDDE